MLYAFDNLNLITDETLEEMIHDMPIERQRKANSYKNINDKKTCAMAYYLLCNGLKEEYNIENPTIKYNEYGNPYLRDNGNIFFNITHTKNIVACVISDKEVGIDIEELREYNEGVARKILNDDEFEKVKDDKDYTKYWTIKEAVCKCEGTGIANFDFKNIDYTKYDFDMKYYTEHNAYLTVCYKKS